nr:MAG TPA: hypothetical protein [Caudoviricetes sp.]
MDGYTNPIQLNSKKLKKTLMISINKTALMTSIIRKMQSNKFSKTV